MCVNNNFYLFLKVHLVNKANIKITSKMLKNDKPLITNHLQLHSNLVLTHHDSDSESVCNFTIVKLKLSFK